nr:SH3 domain-containing protein [Anaerolineae bacterium]
MNRRIAFFFLFWLFVSSLVVGLAAVTAAPTWAAQDDPSPTPSRTLPPPPEGRGRVNVYLLVVRSGPSTEWLPIGLLEYGKIIEPRGKSPDGLWVAIDWRGGQGWVFARLVNWPPDFDLNDLPTFANPATPTATVPPATLLPAPEGGGLVVVRVLVVRQGPSMDFDPIGGLDYGSQVFPVGRSPKSDWVLIPYGNTRGWIAAWHVEWDPELNLGDLPVVESPPTPTPYDTPTSTSTTTAVPTNTMTPASTLVEPTQTPQPSATLVPPPTQPEQPTTTPSPASGAAALPTATTLPTQPPDTATTTPSPQAPQNVFSSGLKMVGIILVGSVLLFGGILGLYGWIRARALRELHRYEGGFVIDTCPVCRAGALSLEEHIVTILGIPRVRRSVLCTNCRSVLRQIQPGQWRYTIDPLTNSPLADQYNASVITDDGLSELLHQVSQSPVVDDDVPEPTTEFQKAVEHLEALEANIIAAQENEQQEETAADSTEDALKEEKKPVDDCTTEASNDVEDQVP